MLTSKYSIYRHQQVFPDIKLTNVCRDSKRMACRTMSSEDSCVTKMILAAKLALRMRCAASIPFSLGRPISSKIRFRLQHLRFEDGR